MFQNRTYWNNWKNKITKEWTNYENIIFEKKDINLTIHEEYFTRRYPEILELINLLSI